MENIENAVIDTVLTFSKSTKGTHVYGNEDAGLNFYVPKPYMAGKVTSPEGTKMRLILVPVTE